MTCIDLIGSGGFIGQSLIDNFGNYLQLRTWSHNPSSKDNHFDLNDISSWSNLVKAKPKIVLLLAWPGLPNYFSSHHITTNLCNSVKLIESLEHIQTLVVAGSCYEYGIQNGKLSVEDYACPVTTYGLAKDTLQKVISTSLSYQRCFRFCWGRIFYPYGINQNPLSLYPSLINAKKNRDSVLTFGNPNIVRDFIPVADVSKMLVQLCLDDKANGIFNIGSGNPTTLKDFVDSILKKESIQVEVRYTNTSNRSFEPFSFWADMSQWDMLGL